MFGWFHPKCPLDLPEALAVDQYMSLLAQTFGVERLRAAVVVRPTPEFFPDSYVEADAVVHRLFRQVCSWMGVDPARVELQLAADDGNPAAGRGSQHIPGRPDKVVIGRSRLRDPTTLTAAVAAGLARHLLWERGPRPHPSGLDALADVLTVFLGMGVFAANSTISESYARGLRVYRWRMERQGALSEKQFGYALALFAWVRDERRAPAWSADLRPNVRAPFGQSLRYLVKTGDAQFKPVDEEVGLGEGSRLARRVEALESPSRGARLAALWDLREKIPTALPILVMVHPLLKAEDSPLQVQAAEVLGAIGPSADAAVPDLLDAALQDHDRRLRLAATAALGRIGSRYETVVPGLMYLLNSAESSDRILAAWALGRFGASAAAAVDRLVEMLQEGNSSVAAEAAYALGAIGGAAAVAVPAIVEALNHGEGDLPAGAAFALGRMGAPAKKAAAALRKALRHMDPTVSEQAALSLDWLGLGETAATRPSSPSTRRSEIYCADPRFRQP